MLSPRLLLLCGWLGLRSAAASCGGAPAFLFATCCLGYDYLRFNLGTEFTLDRLWMILLVGIAIVQRKLGHADPKPWTKLEWTLAAFIALLGLHILLQENATETRLSGSPCGTWSSVMSFLRVSISSHGRPC